MVSLSRGVQRRAHIQHQASAAKENAASASKEKLTFLSGAAAVARPGIVAWQGAAARSRQRAAVVPVSYRGILFFIRHAVLMMSRLPWPDVRQSLVCFRAGAVEALSVFYAEVAVIVVEGYGWGIEKGGGHILDSHLRSRLYELLELESRGGIPTSGPAPAGF